MLGTGLDLSAFTAIGGDLADGVAIVGAALLTAFVGVKTFGFIKSWIGGLFRASKGGNAS